MFLEGFQKLLSFFQKEDVPPLRFIPEIPIPIPSNKPMEKNLIGKFVIRTAPLGGDRSFMQDPIKIVKVVDSIILYKWTGFLTSNKIHKLDSFYLDGHWKLADARIHGGAFLYNRCQAIKKEVDNKQCSKHVYALMNTFFSYRPSSKKENMNAIMPINQEDARRSVLNRCEKVANQDVCISQVQELFALYQRYGLVEPVSEA